jgi:hypothetical protein
VAEVVIRRIPTGEEVARIEVGRPSWREYERAMRGLVAKLRHDCYLDDSAVEIREGSDARQ